MSVIGTVENKVKLEENHEDGKYYTEDTNKKRDVSNKTLRVRVF